MLNHIVIMGRLTRDPELRHTQSGTAVASFTVAVDRDFKDKETGERKTDFIDCVAWRSTGEFVSKYFAKGRMAVVEGRLQLRDWKDKEGNKRRSAEVLASSVYFGTASPRTVTARPRRARMTISSCLVISAPALTAASRIWRMTTATCRSENVRREGRPSRPHGPILTVAILPVN